MNLYAIGNYGKSYIGVWFKVDIGILGPRPQVLYVEKCLFSSLLG